MAYSIGIDLGGTKIAGALVSFTGEEAEVLVYEKIAVDGQRRVERVFNDISELVYSLLGKLGKEEKLLGLGIACPGLVDVERGVMVYSENLNWRNVEVASFLDPHFDFPLFIEHDVRSGAIAEVFFGVGREYRNLVYLSVGTGIAGTLVWERHIIRGVRGISAEFGHVVINPGGPLCRCGNVGCLETLASGGAMEREAYHVLRQVVDGTTIMQRAKEGVEPFSRIVDRAAHFLGIGLANIAQIFDPEVIIIGGGVAEAGDFWLEQVYRHYQVHQFWSFPLPPLLLSRFLGKASVVGAAGLPWLKKAKFL